MASQASYGEGEAEQDEEDGDNNPYTGGGTSRTTRRRRGNKVSELHPDVDVEIGKRLLCVALGV